MSAQEVLLAHPAILSLLDTINVYKEPTLKLKPVFCSASAEMKEQPVTSRTKKGSVINLRSCAHTKKDAADCVMTGR